MVICITISAHLLFARMNGSINEINVCQINGNVQREGFALNLY